MESIKDKKVKLKIILSSLPESIQSLKRIKKTSEGQLIRFYEKYYHPRKDIGQFKKNETLLFQYIQDDVKYFIYAQDFKKPYFLRMEKEIYGIIEKKKGFIGKIDALLKRQQDFYTKCRMQLAELE